MKVLLTGSRGFIGSHTKNLLAKNKHQVNEFIGDITNISDWLRNLEYLPESIVHIAGVNTESNQDFAINVGGVEALSKALEKLPIKPKSLIFISSQAVYFGLKPPFKEAMNLNPQTLYGKSKFEAEELVSKIAKVYSMRTIILRPGVVLGFGVREGSNMSGPLFIWTKKALKNQPIEVFQDGKQTRDFIGVNDLALAILLALENDQVKGIYNIGGGRKIKLLDLAKWLKKAKQSQSKIVIKGQKATISDPHELFSDTRKIKKFGWKVSQSIKNLL